VFIPPISPVLGMGVISGAAQAAVQLAASALGGSKGAPPEGEDEKEPGGPSRGTLGALLGLPRFDPVAAKTALIQGAVVTALVVMFFIGLAMFVSRSVKIK